MTTSPVLCKTCKKPKAPYLCGLCEEYVCKSCAQFLGEEAFSFLPVVSEELKHACYCYNCYDDKIAAPLSAYNDTMEKARDIIIYGKDQARLTRFLKRKEDPYKVDGCIDSDEAVMKMAFMAAQQKFNCIIDVVVVSSKKHISGSATTSSWSATGVPITIDPNEIRGH